MIRPVIAMCNIFSDLSDLKEFAYHNNFSGIDWSFELDKIPKTPVEESEWAQRLSLLAPFEVRYHCPFYKMDIGHLDPAKAKAAGTLFRRIIRLVSKAGGRFLSIHIGLGRNSTEPLSWDMTIDNLSHLVQYGAEHGIKVCLENLAWGWTSKPNLFEKLLRRSGAWVTFDTGHAEASESVRSQQYAVEDFVSPHVGRVLNSHIYHREISGIGHIPPKDLADIESHLSLLQKIECNWWVIEIKEPEGLLRTKEIIEQYLLQVEKGNHPEEKAPI